MQPHPRLPYSDDYLPIGCDALPRHRLGNPSMHAGAALTQQSTILCRKALRRARDRRIRLPRVFAIHPIAATAYGHENPAGLSTTNPRADAQRKGVMRVRPRVLRGIYLRSSGSRLRMFLQSVVATSSLAPRPGRKQTTLPHQ
jgi:hypothetical protein